MRFRTDPPGESERLEHSGVKVDLLFGKIPLACRCVVRGIRRVGSRFVQIGVGNMPFSLVIGVVPAGTKPVAHRGNRGGVKPVEVTFNGGFRNPRCLGNAMERGVLTSQERRTARCTR